MHFYKFIIITLLVVLSSCENKKGESIEAKPLQITNQELFNYVEYCNNRFAFCIDYPSNFSAQPSSANGDGKVFLNKIDDAAITVYGELDAQNQGLNPHIQFIKNQMNVTDSVTTENGIEFTGNGKNDDKIYNYKILTREIVDKEKTIILIYSIELSYPANKSKEYTKVWKNLLKTIRFTN